MTQLTEFAARLKAARELIGYESAREFAIDIDMGYARYCNYEGGRRLPNNTVIMQLCEFMGISAQWLKTGQGQPFEDKQLKSKAKANKHKLDQLVDLGLAQITHGTSTGFDKTLMVELMFSIGGVTRVNANKICKHYEQIVANEDNPQQRLKLAKALLGILSK